jgi:hypothetical protein
MATSNPSKRPATTLRCGNIEAAIWKNVSKKGLFFATTVRSWPITRVSHPGSGRIQIVS